MPCNLGQDSRWPFAAMEDSSVYWTWASSADSNQHALVHVFA